MIPVDHDFMEAAARFKRELYGEYGYFYYVPMAESRTVQLPVTVGCSYGRCLFCDLNQGMRYRELPLPEILDKIGKLRFIHQHDRRPVRRFLLAGGNPFGLPTEKPGPAGRIRHHGLLHDAGQQIGRAHV